MKNKQVSKYFIEDNYLNLLEVIFKRDINTPDCFEDGTFKKLTGYSSYQEAVDMYVHFYRLDHSLHKEIEIDGTVYYEEADLNQVLKENKK